jgi:hypothetical protein
MRPCIAYQEGEATLSALKGTAHPGSPQLTVSRDVLSSNGRLWAVREARFCTLAWGCSVNRHRAGVCRLPPSTCLGTHKIDADDIVTIARQRARPPIGFCLTRPDE